MSCSCAPPGAGDVNQKDRLEVAIGGSRCGPERSVTPLLVVLGPATPVAVCSASASVGDTVVCRGGRSEVTSSSFF